MGEYKSQALKGRGRLVGGIRVLGVQCSVYCITAGNSEHRTQSTEHRFTPHDSTAHQRCLSHPLPHKGGGGNKQAFQVKTLYSALGCSRRLSTQHSALGTIMLLVGLGNPGNKYAETRHNTGAMVIDEIARQYSLSTPQNKFRSEFFQGEVGGQKIHAIKPATYMNNSGVAVQEAAHFYKIPLSDIFVFYDELDLEVGRLRVKTGGSDGGHNGIKSIDAHIGRDYNRIRIGIGHPGEKSMVTSYVLHKFSREEKTVMDKVIPAIATYIPLLLTGEPDKFMSKVALELK